MGKNYLLKEVRVLFLFITMFFISCSTGFEEKENSGNKGELNNPDTAEEYEANSSFRNIAEDDSQSIVFENRLYIDLNVPSWSCDNVNWKNFSSAKETILTDSNGNKISGEFDSATGELGINSSKSGETIEFVITGSTENMHLVFENKKETAVGIVLSDMSIMSSGNYPGISFDKKARIYLKIEGTNVINDGRNYGYGYGPQYSTSSSDTYLNDSGESETCTVSKNPVSEGTDTKATIYSKGPLLLSGTGTLNLSENYKHGIYSKDYIRVFGGNWNIVTSGRNGIQSVNGFVMDDGSIKIKGTGKNTNNQSRGIIVEGSEDETNAGEGFILIKGGKLDVETVGKAISAKWDIDEDAETDVISDDPYPYVKIVGGDIKIKTTGTPADESRTAYTFYDADGVSVSEKTKLSPEGIEGKTAVFIEGGNLDVQTTDDCINASRSSFAKLVISGGQIYAYSSGNDAIDSNGIMKITGGTIVAIAPTVPECAFDCDNYTFSISGGTFIGIGTSNYSRPTASECTQSTVVLSGDYLGTGGRTFILGTSESEPVFAYTIDSAILSKVSSSNIAIISSPEIKQNVSYSLFADSSVNGGLSFNGLYTELPSSSGGTLKTSGIKTSSSSLVYTLSSSTNGGPQEGPHGNPQDGTQQRP